MKAVKLEDFSVFGGIDVFPLAVVSDFPNTFVTNEPARPGQGGEPKIWCVPVLFQIRRKRNIVFVTPVRLMTPAC